MATKSKAAAADTTTTSSAAAPAADGSAQASTQAGLAADALNVADSAAPVAGGAGPAAGEVNAAGEAISEVPTADGETIVERDRVLDTPADPKTASGDIVRKEAGISASATAEQVLAGSGADTTDHSAALSPAADVPAVPTAPFPAADDAGVPVRVLSDVTLGGVRFRANEIIEGVPGSLADQQAGSLDAHPDAVAYARSQGFPARQYWPAGV